MQQNSNCPPSPSLQLASYHISHKTKLEHTKPFLTIHRQLFAQKEKKCSAIFDVRLLRLITNQNNVTDWRHIHQISQPEAAALTIKYKQSFLAIISMSKGRVHFRKKSFYWNLFLYIKGTCSTIAHMKNWFEVLPWNGLMDTHSYGATWNRR